MRTATLYLLLFLSGFPFPLYEMGLSQPALFLGAGVGLFYVIFITLTMGLYQMVWRVMAP